MNIIEFSRTINQNLSFEYRPHSKKWFVGFFHGLSVMERGGLVPYKRGVGDYPIDALNDLSKNIRGLRLTWKPMNPLLRTEYDVPDLSDVAHSVIRNTFYYNGVFR